MFEKAPDLCYPVQEMSRLYENKKIFVVMPAYNAAMTLEKTCVDIPQDVVDEIILVDDASTDNTVEIARKLNLKVLRHPSNKGYGANQKTCYNNALSNGADIIVMLHPDYQYDPRIILNLVEPIASGRAEVVFASRMLSNPLSGGMPLYKFVSNKLLTAVENFVFGTNYSEFHTGYRAFSKKALSSVLFSLNSDGFVFDNEIIAQLHLKDFKIYEVPVETRYGKDASSTTFFVSVSYGLGVLKTIAKYVLHKYGLFRFKEFL